MSRNKHESNLGLAGLFVLLVLGLIILSLLLKIFVVFKDSKFDGTHNFIVGLVGKNQTKIISFSPQNKTISVINVQSSGLNRNALEKALEVPIDGMVNVDNNILNKDISTILLKSSAPFTSSLNGLTFIDTFRLSLFAKSVQSGSIYDRSFSANLNDEQRSTLLSLSFTDPTIYQENLGIQIINASEVAGVGNRLANLITNLGGNPILVTTADPSQYASKIIYYKTKSYSAQRLSAYLGFPLEKTDKKGIADVTIIIGKDKINNPNF
jgi:hypothetical protein